MQRIELKATFKSITIKDKAMLQFEVDTSQINANPDLTKLTTGEVFLTVEGAQMEMPIEEVEAEIVDDQTSIDDYGELALPDIEADWEEE